MSGWEFEIGYFWVRGATAQKIAEWFFGLKSVILDEYTADFDFTVHENAEC